MGFLNYRPASLKASGSTEDNKLFYMISLNVIQNIGNNVPPVTAKIEGGLGYKLNNHISIFLKGSQTIKEKNSEGEIKAGANFKF